MTINQSINQVNGWVGKCVSDFKTSIFCWGGVSQKPKHLKETMNSRYQ